MSQTDNRKAVGRSSWTPFLVPGWYIWNSLVPFLIELKNQHPAEGESNLHKGQLSSITSMESRVRKTQSKIQVRNNQEHQQYS